MTALDPELLQRPGLDRTLGVEYLEVGPERVRAALTVDERHLQPFGYLHGGVNVALAESVASVGATVAAPEGQVAFGLEINMNHLRPVRPGGRIVATAEPLHRGRSTQVWAIEIRDGRDRRVAVGRCTLALRPAALDNGPAD